ncbi:DUF58 domain-containing protein [Glaciecola sp. 1036]|uniref:DUF58 domain-containing protein n=1 Tax=Alteromonadaceae TaxID=72275 RepID=UPI003D038BB2
MIYKLKKRYWTWHYNYIIQRAAAKQNKGFNIHNTFVLPSSFGWATIAVGICLFILGTNYQNNIVLSMCYLLMALVLLSLFHSYFYFTQHKLRFLPVQPDFANRRLHLEFELDSMQRYEFGQLDISLGKLHNKINVTASGEKSQHISIQLPQLKRGIHALPGVCVQATYGLGLFKCWSYLVYPDKLIVYPSVIKHPPKLHKMASDSGGASSSDSQMVVSDNLQGIRSYQKTDPLHHVSWKHVAKGQGMLSKDFTENAGVSGWLFLADYQHLDTEKALSILCFQVQQLHRDKVKFGIDLGTTKVLPNLGDKHQLECLSLLASFNQSPSTTSFLG